MLKQTGDNAGLIFSLGFCAPSAQHGRQAQNINENTLKRQERILSRLLDATKSIHDRDYEKTRESKTGKEFNRQSPGEIDLKSQEGNLKIMLLTKFLMH